jgi:hypothetical protein
MEEEYVSEAVTSPEWESIKAPNIMDEYDRIMSGNDQGDTDPFSAESGRMIEPLEVIDLDMEPGTSLPDFTKNFDAREAVVYSAIINRLDY